jgi:hypothetical protein
MWRSASIDFRRMRSGAGRDQLREKPPPRAVFGYQHAIAPGQRQVGVPAAPLLPRSSLTTCTSMIWRR